METRKTNIELKPVPAKGLKSDLPKVDYVQVQETPGAAIKTMPVGEFMQKANMIGWCESNLIREADIDAIKKIPISTKNLTKNALKKIYKEINSHKDNFVITYVNESVKFSVTAQHPILAQTYLTTFSGLIEKCPEGNYKNEYSFGVLNQASGVNGIAAVINCQDYGNIARFFLHAPDKAQPQLNPEVFSIQDYRFAGIKPTDVLTANVDMIEMSSNNYPIMLVQASENIPRGSQIACNYGRAYWAQHAVSPLLMAKDGSFINPDQYAIDRIEIIIYRGEPSGGFENPFLRFTLSLDDLKQDFIQHGAILCRSDDSEVFGVSEELFFTHYYQHLHSPILHFPKPDVVIPKEESEEQNTAHKGHSLFGPSKKIAVLGELSRISESLLLPQWAYNIKNDTAFLSAPSICSAQINTLKDYLYMKALTVELAFKAGTNDPVLMVKNPSVTQLKCIEAFVDKSRLVMKPA